jgi:putative FmdB family regulatory protein
MPIYTFRCPACGREVDVIRAVPDRDLDEPCVCGSTGLMLRQPAAPAFTVKGFNAKTGYGAKSCE